MSGNEWIEWHGGDCPVAPETMVDCWLACDVKGEARHGRPAGDYWWHHDGEGYDIIKYRIVGAAK